MIRLGEIISIILVACMPYFPVIWKRIKPKKALVLPDNNNIITFGRRPPVRRNPLSVGLSISETALGVESSTHESEDSGVMLSDQSETNRILSRSSIRSDEVQIV